jgi:rubrerythrin
MNRQKPASRLQFEDLLYQALETELGGIEIYKMAILCAKNPDLKEEWKKYLTQTKRHAEILEGVFGAASLDPDATTPGRLIVREKGKMLLSAMQRALTDAPQSAEVVAAECVVDAETKDHKNWELIGAVAEKSTGEEKKALSEAYAAVEDEEDEHLYHTMGWSRELSLQALGLPAVLPPPEEEKKVKTAVAAARAKQERKESLKEQR